MRDPLPRREDFFPKTRRGHGSIGHCQRNHRGDRVHHEVPCVDSSCVLNAPKSSNLHTDSEANLRDWCADHGLSLRSKDRPNGRFRDPMRAMYVATGGRL